MFRQQIIKEWLLMEPAEAVLVDRRLDAQSLNRFMELFGRKKDLNFVAMWTGFVNQKPNFTVYRLSKTSQPKLPA